MMRTWQSEHTIFVSHGNIGTSMYLHPPHCPFDQPGSLIAANHLFLSTTNLPSHQVFSRDHTLFLIDLMCQHIMSNEAELPNTCQSLVQCQKDVILLSKSPEINWTISVTVWPMKPHFQKPSTNSAISISVGIQQMWFTLEPPKMNSSWISWFSCPFRSPMQRNKRCRVYRNLRY